MDLPYYETEKGASEYLLFHYGNEKEIFPFSFNFKEALHFPEKCISQCIDTKAISSHAKALDLGCAVGRSSFELSRYFNSVIGVDNSSSFISLAKRIQRGEKVAYSLQEEGRKQSHHVAELPPHTFPERVDFVCADVMNFSPNQAPFDLVLGANLLCRLPSPSRFLTFLPKWVAPKGVLILVSPCSWLEMYTPKENWPDERGTLTFLSESLQGNFTLMRSFDLPFLIREHRRKYQLGISEVTLWIRQG